MMLNRIFPFLNWLPEARGATLRADLVAGLTGAVIVLPQGVAYALIAGLPPEFGLYGAVVIALVAGLFGSSMHLVSGPTAALSIVVFSVVSGVVSPDSPEFIPYVITVTFLAGLIQLGLGMAKLGGVVNFISHTVVVGFTTGAAVLIATSQLRHLLGLDMSAGGSFINTVVGVVQRLPDFHLPSMLIGMATLGVVLLVAWAKPRWPGMLIAMLAASIFAWLLGGEERGLTMVGGMPGQLPPMTTPVLSPDVLSKLVPGALALAVIGLIEAAAISRAIAAYSRQRVDGNQEFIGQGLSNIVGSFFSCYVGSGSFTRTAANFHAGAVTPVSVIVSALIVVTVLLLAPGITGYLPMPAMAAIVLLIAWRLVSFQQWGRILRASRQETLILLVTFASTLALALEFAIYLGVLLSLLLFLKRAGKPRLVPVAPTPNRPGNPYRNALKRNLPQCPQLRILRLDGSLFFGAVDHVQSVLRGYTDAGYRHIVIVGPGVNFIDMAGAEMLVSEAERLRALGGGLYLCGFKDPAIELLRRPQYKPSIGEENIFSSPEAAVSALFPLLDRTVCEACTARIFQQCDSVPTRSLLGAQSSHGP
ncbi:MAG: SulP family inorganic anion transporter [Ectothiorhodospiraceae bacterium]|nr:SulP family inorganic anion transporter [Ectothiorhodospiraceae bacterium]